MDERQELAPSERAESYRAYAEEAIGYAKAAATEEIRAAYLKIAEDWLTLADSIEAHYGKLAAPVNADIALRKQAE